MGLMISMEASDNHLLEDAWIEITRPSLVKEESRLLEMEYAPPEDGYYTVTFHASDVSGNTETNIAYFHVLNPGNVVLTPAALLAVISAGSSYTTELLLNNTGEVEAAVVMSSDSDWVTVHPGSVVIEALGSAEITVNVLVPADAAPGDYEITVTAIDADTFILYVTVPDEQLPEFAELSYSDINYGQEETVIATVTDNAAVDTCLIDYGEGNRTMPSCSYTWIPERTGEIPFTVYVNDTSGNWNSASGSFTVTDTEAPHFISHVIEPKAVIVNKTLVVDAEVTDNYQLDKIWAEIGSVRVDIPVNHTVTAVGRHNVVIYANDTSGNVNWIENYFIAAEPIVFTGTVIGFNDTNLTGGMQIYFPNTEEVIASAEYNGNFSVEAPDYIFDLEIRAFDDSVIVRLKGLNISASLNKTVEIDKSLSGDYLLTCSVVNPYIMENASITLSYAGLEYRNENNLRVYKCDAWDFDLGECLEGWTQIAAEQNLDEDYFTIHVESFNGFAIRELEEKTRRRRYRMNVTLNFSHTGVPVTLIIKNDKTNEPVDEVDVDVFLDGEKVAYGLTDEEGRFEFVPDEDGVYRIEIDRSGYYSEDIHIEIAALETTTTILQTTTSTSSSSTTTTLMEATIPVSSIETSIQVSAIETTTIGVEKKPLKGIDYLLLFFMTIILLAVIVIYVLWRRGRKPPVDDRRVVEAEVNGKRLDRN